MISNIKSARLLGYTSLAVGMTEIVGAKWLENRMGIDDHATLIRLYGVRELAAGAAILREPGINGGLAAALWARVAGDVLDIGTLCVAATTTRKRSGLITVAAVILAVTGLDILIASLVQHDVVHGRTISHAARERVVPTTAIPAVAAALSEPTEILPDKMGVSDVSDAQLEQPVSLGNG